MTFVVQRKGEESPEDGGTEGFRDGEGSIYRVEGFGSGVTSELHGKPATARERQAGSLP